MSTNLDLSSLLAQSAALTAHVTHAPPLTRSLPQIEALSRSLHQSDHVSHRTAALLGVDPDKLAPARIGHLEVAPKSTEKLNDVASFLNHWLEDAVTTAVERSKNDVFRRHEELTQKAIAAKYSKKNSESKLGESVPKTAQYGLYDSQGEATRPSSASLLKVPQEALNQTTRFQEYLQVVRSINEARCGRQNIAILASFNDLFKTSGPQNLSEQPIGDAWRLLLRLLHEPTSYQGQFSDTSLGPLEYAAVYKKLETEPKSPEAIKFRKALIEGGKSFLEEQFWIYIENTVRQNRIPIGGIPDAHAIVNAYVQLRYMRYGQWHRQYIDVVNGKAIWAHTFFLLRSGHYQEALEFVAEHESDFSRTDSSFLTYFKAWATSEDKRLPKRLRDTLLQFWNNNVRPLLITDQKNAWAGGDPFRIALYKIIGRCEMNRKIIPGNDVQPTTDDYLWFQLMLVSEEVRPDDPPFEQYTLKDMSTLMRQFGAEHFSPKGKSPTIWFFVLLLCGEFERAIYYLATFESYFMDAFHFALALNYYGVLRIPEAPNDTTGDVNILKNVSVTVGGDLLEFAYLNFGSFMDTFVRFLVKNHPLDALLYISFLCLSDNDRYTEYAHRLMVDIIMKNLDKKFELLGQIQKDGTRNSGTIEKYQHLFNLGSRQEFLIHIVRAVADRCYREGKVVEAIRVYDIAQEYETVVMVLNKHLSETLSERRYNLSMTGLSPSKKKDEQDPVMIAEDIMNMYLTTPAIASAITTGSQHVCGVLRALHQFMKYSSLNDFQNALTTMDTLDLVPSVYDVALIQRKAYECNYIDESISRVLPFVLVALMQVYSRLYKKLSEYGDVHRLNELKNRSKAVILFAANLKYRLSSDVYTMLNRMEAEMK